VSVVVDASVVLRLLLQTGAVADDLRTTVATEDLHAPALVDVEVVSGLRRLAAVGSVESGRAVEAVADLALLGIERYPHTPLLPRIWQLRANLSAYDATYAALAETLGCPLVTSDRGLATAPGPRCERRHLP
jgi:predicted nucleic acid-binding protein